MEQENHICSKCGREFNNVQSDRNNQIRIRTKRRDPNIDESDVTVDTLLYADLCPECEKDLDCKVREFINLLTKEFNFK